MRRECEPPADQPRDSVRKDHKAEAGESLGPARRVRDEAGRVAWIGLGEPIPGLARTTFDVERDDRSIMIGTWAEPNQIVTCDRGEALTAADRYIAIRDASGGHDLAV